MTAGSHRFYGRSPNGQMIVGFEDPDIAGATA